MNNIGIFKKYWPWKNEHNELHAESSILYSPCCAEITITYRMNMTNPAMSGEKSSARWGPGGFIAFHHYLERQNDGVFPGRNLGKTEKITVLWDIGHGLWDIRMKNLPRTGWKDQFASQMYIFSGTNLGLKALVCICLYSIQICFPKIPEKIPKIKKRQLRQRLDFLNPIWAGGLYAAVAWGLRIKP